MGQDNPHPNADFERPSKENIVAGIAEILAQVTIDDELRIRILTKIASHHTDSPLITIVPELDELGNIALGFLREIGRRRLYDIEAGASFSTDEQDQISCWAIDFSTQGRMIVLPFCAISTDPRSVWHVCRPPKPDES